MTGEVELLPILSKAAALLGIDPSGKIGLAPPFRSDRRMPDITDDSSKGYSVGDLWLFNRKAWQAASVAAGAALWLPMALGLDLPLDVAPNAAAAYSPTLLTSNYKVNKALDITRLSDGTTLTIGFINGEIDFASADAFVAGTQGYVTKVYDQSVSGGFAGAYIAYNGLGYTSIPTLTVIDPYGVGSGATAAAIMGVNSGTVATGSTGGTNGTQTFTLVGGTLMSGNLPDGTTPSAMTLTGVVSGGVLSGALTITNPGTYSALPTLSGATLSGGGFGTGPTVNLNMGVYGIQPTAAGSKYSAPTETTKGPYITFSGGGASSSFTPANCQVNWTANGNDATNASFSSAPLWTKNKVAGRRVIDFSPWFKYPGTTGAQQGRYLTIPTTLSVAPASLTAFFVGQPHSSAVSNAVAAIGPGTSNTIMTSQFYPTNNLGVTFQGQYVTPKLPAPISPTLFVWEIRSGAWKYHVGNAVGTNTNGASATPVTGGTLGSSSASNTYGPSDMRMAAFVVYNRTMTATEISLAKAAFNIKFDLMPPQTNDAIVTFIGDSISYGYRSYLNTAYSLLMREQLDRNVKFYSSAIPGNAVIDAINYLPYDFANIYDPKAAVIVVNIMMGVNTIGYATPNTAGSGTTAYNQIVTLISNIRAYDTAANVKIHLITIPSRKEGGVGSGSYNTEINTLNALIRANWLSIGADAMTDLAMDPIIGNPAGSTNPSVVSDQSIFQVDGVHYTDFGLRRFDEIATPNTRALLSPVLDKYAA